MRIIAATVCFTLVAAASASAQAKPPKPKRLFFSLSAGAQLAASSSERFTYTLNAEEATTDARYPTKVGALFDAGLGWRFGKTWGLALGGSYNTVSRKAETVSQVPHPFFDDQLREVRGEARGLDRTETSGHLQLFFERIRGRWTMRFLGGASYFSVEEEVIASVTVEETYPFDTAEFRGVTTPLGTGSALGFNVGADVSRMFTPALGIGGLLRYARAKVDLNATGVRTVSTDAGGIQAAVGIRFVF